MTTSTLLEEARIDAVDNIATAIVAAAEREIVRHGRDPKALVLLASGFAQAIRDIRRSAHPDFWTLLSDLVTHDEGSCQ